MDEKQIQPFQLPFHPSLKVDFQGSPVSKGSLQLIAEIGRQISPESASLRAWSDGYISGHAGRLAFDLDLVRRYARAEDRVLDVGSVPPVLSGALKQLGYDVQGVDIAPERFESSFARLNVPVAKCDIEVDKLPFPDGSFSVVIFNELFEHLRINPIFTMREIFRVTRSGGILLLSTPNLKSLKGITNFLVHGKAYSCCEHVFDEYEKLSRLGHMGHVREYTAREVCEFLSRIGFRVQKCVYRGGYGAHLQSLFANLIIQLKPFVTVVAVRP